jgi:hypothetical protein
MPTEIYVNEQQYRRRVRVRKAWSIYVSQEILLACGVRNETLEAKPTKT